MSHAAGVTSVEKPLAIVVLLSLSLVVGCGGRSAGGQRSSSGSCCGAASNHSGLSLGQRAPVQNPPPHALLGLDQAYHESLSSERPGLALPLKFVRSRPQRPSPPSNPGCPRHLAEASASLHGSLMSLGYYYVEVALGVPAQHFSLLVDTGSALTFVPGERCRDRCGLHMNTPYSTELSSTHEGVSCSSPECLSRKCNPQRECLYKRRFAENSSTAGVLVSDVLSFDPDPSSLPSTKTADSGMALRRKFQPDISGPNRKETSQPADAISTDGTPVYVGPSHFSVSSLPRIVFGAAEAESGQLFAQKADGVLGLGRGLRSVVEQLASKSGMPKEFSLCYSGIEESHESTGGGGALVLGPNPQSLLRGMTWTKFDGKRQGTSYFQVSVQAIRVAGQDIPVDATAYDRGYGAIVDSGTTFTYLPTPSFLGFQSAVLSHLKNVEAVHEDDPNYHGLCFKEIVPSRWANTSACFPTVDIVFGGHTVHSVDVENYVFQHHVNPELRCIGIYPNPDAQAGVILGALLWQNTLVSFDLVQERLGFQKMADCSGLRMPLSPLSNAKFKNGEGSPEEESPASVIGSMSTGDVTAGSSENQQEDAAGVKPGGKGSYEQQQQKGQEQEQGQVQEQLSGTHPETTSEEIPDSMAAALALAGASIFENQAAVDGHIDGDTPIDGLVHTSRAVDPSGCENCAASIDITLSFNSIPQQPQPGSFDSYNPSSWAFLPELVRTNLSLLPDQVQFASVEQNSSGGVDVKLAVVPYGAQRFIQGIVSDRVLSGIQSFTLNDTYIALTGPFTITSIVLTPPTFGPVSVVMSIPYNWRPWVFASLAVLVVLLAVVWIFKCWRERRKAALNAKKSYVSMTRTESKRDEEDAPSLPDCAPVIAKGPSSSSLTTVCHSPKRALVAPQI